MMIIEARMLGANMYHHHICNSSSSTITTTTTNSTKTNMLHDGQAGLVSVLHVDNRKTNNQLAESVKSQATIERSRRCQCAALTISGSCGETTTLKQTATSQRPLASDAAPTLAHWPKFDAAPRVLHRHARTGMLLFSVACVILARTTLGQNQTFTDATTTTPASSTQASTGTSSTPANEQTNAATVASAALAPAKEQSNETAADEHHHQQPTKLKPVNFTLVDQLFTASLDDQELIKRWKHMDNQFQDGIRSVLKLIFPQIVAISQDAKVSGDCSGGILKWILSLRNLRSWAIKMLDATGKPTSGIFQGSLTMMGNYGQCLSVRAPDEDEIEITDQFEEYFRGQYCVVHLRPHLPDKKPFYHLNSTIDSLLRKQYKYYEKTLYDELAEIAIAFHFIDIRLDLCVPSTCTRADIQRVAELLSKKLEFRAKVLRCDIEARDSNTTLSSIMVNDQQTQYWLAFPFAIIILSLLATLLVLVKPAKFDIPKQSSNFAKLIYSLSFQAGLNHILVVPKFLQQQSNCCQVKLSQSTISTPVADLTKPWPLYGLRNLFLIWFIIVQMTIQLKYQYLRESLVLRNMLLSYWPFQIIINTTMIFESFLLITAFTHGYCNLESSIGQLFVYIVRKYTRIVPSMIMLIAVTILTPSLAIFSPVWRNFVDEQAATCKSTGYLNLFFLQNFISYNKICIPHSWLLCVEMQLIALSIPLVALLKRTFTHIEDSSIVDRASENGLKNNNGRIGMFNHNLVNLLKSKEGYLSLLVISFGAGLNFFIVYTNRLPPTWFNTFPDPEHRDYYFGSYLAKTWTHLSTFVLGLLAGHLCRSTLELMQRNQSNILSNTTHSSNNDNDNHIEKQGICDNSSSSSESRITTPSTSTTTITNESPTSSRGLVISVPQMQSSSLSNQDHQVNRSTSYRYKLLQSSALILLMAVIFSTYSWSTQELPTPLVSALFDSLSRLIWSIALVGLMIQLCLPKSQTNNLTRFAQLLSCQSLIYLGRLSLLAYLWAPYVHTFILAVQEQALFPSLLLIFHVIVGNIVITYVISLTMSILIEQPVKLVINNCVLPAQRRGTK